MIEENIYSALSATFSGRVFRGTAPAGVTMPFLVYSNVGGAPVNALCGNGAHQNYRIQFTVWCDVGASSGGQTQANSLMRAVEAIVTEPPLRGVSQGSLISIYDDVTRYYGAMQDFSFWI